MRTQTPCRLLPVLSLGLAATTLAFLGAAGQVPASDDAIAALAKQVRTGASLAGADERVVVTPLALTRAMAGAVGAWSPGSERSRGAALEDLYRRRAPSVVVVRTSTGHGTGFLVAGGPYVVTNAHVVHDGLQIDFAKQTSFANVHTGTIGSNGVMQVATKARRAFVLKSDDEKDLAVLQLEPEQGAAAPTPLELAATGPVPGSDCTIIGHPASGMLWTIRAGNVASAGRAPRDMIDAAMARLAAAPERRAALERQLQAMPGFEMFMSSAGANPGDSGGPVLNPAGQVVGVTFAIPADVGERRFTYHIHVSELKRFLASVPRTPRLVVPDAWDIGAEVAFADLSGDSRADAIVERNDRTGIKFLLDLDGDTKLPAGRPTDEQFEQIILTRSWDLEFALHLSAAESKAFYDSDNDGRIDVVVVGDPQSNVMRLRYDRDAAGGWRVKEGKGAVLSPDYLRSPQLARRLGEFIGGLRTALRQQ